MQSENFAEPGAPDRIPDDLVEKYGREARKTVKHNLSRRSRLARRTRRASRVVRGNGSDLWQTTAVVFSLSVIAVCGLGALVYAVAQDRADARRRGRGDVHVLLCGGPPGHPSKDRPEQRRDLAVLSRNQVRSLELPGVGRMLDLPLQRAMILSKLSLQGARCKP